MQVRLLVLVAGLGGLVVGVVGTLLLMSRHRAAVAPAVAGNGQVPHQDDPSPAAEAPVGAQFSAPCQQLTPQALTSSDTSNLRPHRSACVQQPPTGSPATRRARPATSLRAPLPLLLHRMTGR
jgi:hypothetical protein